MDQSDRAEVRRNLNELKSEGVAAFGAVGQSAVAAGRQTDQHTEALKRVVAEAQALKSAAAQRINMTVGVTYEAPKSARDSAMAFEAAFRTQEEAATRLRANLAAAEAAARPIEAAQARLNARLTEYRDLAKSGAITTQELAAAEALARKEFEATETVLKGRNGATRAQVAARANLGRQAADVAVTGAMGMNPLMIGIQQGPQIVDAWRDAGISISKSALLAGGAISALTVAAGAAIKAGYDYAKAMNEAEVTVMGLGRASGLTADSFMAQAQASSAANNISVKSAREQQAVILNAGISNVDVMQRVIGVTKDYAALTGQDAKSASKELAAALADPSRGAEDLTKKIGLLDYATLQSVKSLAEQGKTAEAQIALIKALEDRIGTAADKTFTWSKAFDAVNSSWSRFWAQVGEQTSLPFRDDPAAVIRRLGAVGQTGDVLKYRPQAFLTSKERAEFEAAKEALRVDRQKAIEDGNKEKEKQAVTAANLTVDAVLGRETKIRELANQRKNLLTDIAAGRIVNPDTGVRDDARGQRAVDEIDKQIAKLRKPDGDKRAERLGREAEATRVNAEMGWKLVDSLDKGAAAMKRAEIQRQAYTDATRKGIAAEAEYQRQLDRFVSDQAVSAAQQAATLEQRLKVQQNVGKAVAAGNLTRRDANELAQVELELADLAVARDAAQGEQKQKLVDIYDRLRAAKLALSDQDRRDAAIDATQANKDELAFLERQIGFLRLSNQERAVAIAREQAIRTAETNGWSGQVAKDFIDSEVAKARGQNRLDAGAASADLERSDAKRLEYLQKAYDLAGQSDRQRERELEALQRRQDLLEAGVEAGSAEYEMAMRRLRVVQDLTDAEQRRSEANREIRDLQERAIDRAGDLLAKGDLNLRSWRNEALMAIQDVGRELLKMALLNPFKNWALGTNLPTLGDAKGAGGLFGWLESVMMGGKKSAGASSGFLPTGDGAGIIDLILSNPMRGGSGLGGLGAAGSVLNIARQAVQPQPVIVLPQYNFNGVTSNELLGQARADTLNIVRSVVSGGMGKAVTSAVNALAPGAVQQNWMDKG